MLYEEEFTKVIIHLSHLFSLKESCGTLLSYPTRFSLLCSTYLTNYSWRQKVKMNQTVDSHLEISIFLVQKEYFF